jgi:hypothetical protein
MLPPHAELQVTLDSYHVESFEELTHIQESNDILIWLRNEVIESFPVIFSTPVIEGGADFTRTCDSGYCSLFALAQLTYIQHHSTPNVFPPDLSDFSAENIAFACEQLAPLSALIENEDSPITEATRTLWALLHSDAPPRELLSSYDQQLWMFDSDFILLASHLKLSFSLWQESYEGPSFSIPSSKAHLSYIYRNGKMKHPSIPSTPYLQLPSFPRALSLGSVGIQSTQHYYICTTITPALLQCIQDELYVHLEHLLDPNSPSTAVEALPLPEPASSCLYRSAHTRTTESKKAARKARLAPSDKHELWEKRRAHDRLVGKEQRELLLSQRQAPNHTISPPLEWAPGARKTPRYDEIFDYYSSHAGGDKDLDVLWGYERPNITGDPNQRGVFAARDLAPPKWFPYVGFLLRRLTKPERQYTHCVSLPPVALMTTYTTG